MASDYERVEGIEVGQYVAYRFFASIRLAPAPDRGAHRGKEAFADVVDDFAGRMEGLRTYSTTGVRPEADFFLWSITQRYDDLLEFGAALNGTPLAGWLTTPHSYLGTTKPSVYTDKKRVRQGVSRRATRRTSSCTRSSRDAPGTSSASKSAPRPCASTPRSAASSSP